MLPRTPWTVHISSRDGARLSRVESCHHAILRVVLLRPPSVTSRAAIIPSFWRTVDPPSSSEESTAPAMLRRGGNTTATNSGGRKKLHTTFEDGAEMVEEYDLNTGELLVRKRRARTVLGGQGTWEYLVGDAEQPSFSGLGGPEIRENSLNPVFGRKDVAHAFQWRVRNLVHPKEVYSVTIEHPERKIVIRTTNKKYFKRFNIPEMDALNLPLDEGSMSWTHANNTLIVTYTKPREVLSLEVQETKEAREIRAKEEGDVDCKQQ